jgi:hypothetical protein
MLRGPKPKRSASSFSRDDISLSQFSNSGPIGIRSPFASDRRPFRPRPNERGARRTRHAQLRRCVPAARGRSALYRGHQKSASTAPTPAFGCARPSPKAPSAHALAARARAGNRGASSPRRQAPRQARAPPPGGQAMRAQARRTQATPWLPEFSVRFFTVRGFIVRSELRRRSWRRSG